MSIAKWEGRLRRVGARESGRVGGRERTVIIFNQSQIYKVLHMAVCMVTLTGFYHVVSANRITWCSKWKHKHIGIIVNILFMAPRMVYFSMIYLLWSIFVEASTTFRPVDYGP